MKLPKHSKATVVIIVAVVLLAGGGAYLYTARKGDNAKKAATSSNDSGGVDSNGKQKKTAPTIKPGTDGPTITSPDPIPAGGPTAASAPKAAN
jgi:hypothetical protein